MKLRNKNTGEIGYIEHKILTTEPLSDETLLTVRYKDDSGVTCYKDYATIKFFSEEWEDYEPKEPLIKDDKIRKAVRAWADVNGVTRLYYHRPTVEVCVNDKDGYVISSIKFKSKFKKDIDIDSGYYTITEICGEDKQ